MTRLLIGAIADDFTGATDLANNFVRAGMPTVQTIGVPAGGPPVDAACCVVALKSRTVAPEIAIARSLEAATWLRAQGAGQIYFKYCSTFDSTPRGNIGPVTEALMDALDCDFTIATPAFPDNGRTVYKGHLFVGDVPLGESSMRDHPLTPMRDANLVRVLQAQCRRRVGLIEQSVVAAGESALRERIAALRACGVGIAIVDAIRNDDLRVLAAAVRDLRLVTAGSGLAIGLPANFGAALSAAASAAASVLPASSGQRAVVAGSCSAATQRQVRYAREAGWPSIALDPRALARLEADGIDPAATLLAQAQPLLREDVPLLVYSSADAATVSSAQRDLGAAAAGALVERSIADVARGLVARGVRRLVVAGGETSGAVVQALGVPQLRIGPQIAPGVPWCHGRAAAIEGAPALHVALKSGNFGGDDFFVRAFAELA